MHSLHDPQFNTKTSCPTIFLGQRGFKRVRKFDCSTIGTYLELSQLVLQMKFVLDNYKWIIGPCSKLANIYPKVKLNEMKLSSLFDPIC